MKKLSNFRPGRICPHFFSHCKDPKEINKGECFIWAYLAHLLHVGVEIWYVDCHAFVRYKGKFYDSENLKGVRDWRDLPATEGCRLPAQHYTAHEFKKGWRTQPKRFQTSWIQIELDAKEYLKHV